MGVKGLNSLILNIYEKENTRRSNVNLIRADAIRKLKDDRDKLNEQEINDLTLLINEKELELLSIKQHINKLQGKRLSIDLSLLLHRALHKGDQDEISSIFKYFIAIIILLRKQDITPIFVFDGKPPNAKNILLEKRRNKRAKAMNKIKTLNKLKDHLNDNSDVNITSILDQSNTEDEEDLEGSNISLDTDEVEYVSSILSDSINSDNGIEDIEKTIDENIQKEGKKGIGIKDKYIIKLKELFNVLKVSYIHIQEEADIVCKYLVTQGYVDGCVSDDMDLLAYGCPILIQNLNFTTSHVNLFDLEELLKIMQLTKSELLDLCICSGTDFNNKLINIKCKEIYTYITKYKTIENIIDNLDEINVNREVVMRNKGLIVDEYKSIKVPYQFKFDKTRNIFNKALDDLYEHLNNYDKNIAFENISSSNIIEFNTCINFVFENTYGWSKNQILNKLSRIMYSKFNKSLYNNLNFSDIRDQENKDKTNYSSIINIINNHSKKNNPNHLNRYIPNGRMKSLTKKKKRRINMNHELDSKMFNHNIKQVNIFNILKVES